MIHRDPAEASEYAARLRAQGFEAGHYPALGAKGFPNLRANPPAVFLIDLMRQPSYGKAMGALLRESASLRSIPLVFIEGDPAKMESVRETLPDALFAPWNRIAAALRRAIECGPREHLPPQPARRTLAAKLGIAEGSLVALVRAPETFALKGLPKGVRLQKSIGEADTVLLFYKSAAAFGRELPTLPGILRKGRKLWILWPKQASPHAGDLTMVRIREMAAPFGLVDYKVCAVDATWAGLVLGVRRKK